MLIALILVAVLLIALIAVLSVLFRKIFYNPKRPREFDPYRGLDSKYLDGMRDVIKAQIDELSTYPCEEITIKSGTKRLFGRYYPGEGNGSLAIFFHGYKGSSYTELSGAALLALSHGQSALLVDHRGHGRSSGTTISFGIKERHDIVAWVKYAAGRFGKERGIFLYGISMGGASVLMASELLSPSDGVCGIIADCPYSSPEAIIKRVIASRGLSCAAYRAVSLCATVVGGFRLGASSAVSAVRKTEIPILLIHGEDDDFVPSDMSREIQAAGKNISLFTVPGAKHGQCFAVAKELFVQRVLTFTDAHTPKNGETK